MRTLTVSKRKLFTILSLVAILTLGILVIRTVPLPINADLHPDDAEAAAAAVSALEAFYQIDYHEGQDAWLERFCAVSTPNGCQFLSLGAGPMWEQFAAARVQVTAAVQPEEKLDGNESEQVWRMQIILSEPLPGSEQTEDSASVLVVKTETGWQFERFLMAQEIEALESEASR